MSDKCPHCSETLPPFKEEIDPGFK